MITRNLIKVASALLLLVYLIPGTGLFAFQTETYSPFLPHPDNCVIWNVERCKVTSGAHMRSILFASRRT